MTVAELHDDDAVRACDAQRLAAAFTAAEAFIAAGFAGFPAAVWRRGDGTVEKVPLTRHGHLDATRDLAELRELLGNPAHYPPSVPDEHDVVAVFVPGSGGAVVLDCDIKHGSDGKGALQRLYDDHRFEVTSAWRSPSGGVNVLCRTGGVKYGNQTPWPGAIDVRGNSGWVVAPGNVTSIGTWGWVAGDYTTATLLTPSVAELLTVAGEPGRQRVTNAEALKFLDAPREPTDNAWALFMQRLDRLRGASLRHPALVDVVGYACGMRHLDLRRAMTEVVEVWRPLLRTDEQRTRADEPWEVFAWCVAQEQPKRERAAALNTMATPGETDDAAVVDGAAFILDESTDLIARWGHDGDVLWAHGESLILCGPSGVGKTTVAGQLVAALIGVQPDVLGLPVLPAQRVLYLAMDRPRQIQRAMRRRFRPEHRQALAGRFLVRRGPLPVDIGRRPELLAELAKEHDADVLIVDSLKDAAVKLTDDEAAGNVNRAIQLCNVADVDVLVLHHQRKGDGSGKPTTLADVYGSTWVTAGAGSVVLLWGEPGSELVELSHLKQPAETVGPFTVEHDHHAGISKVTHGWDALAWLTSRGSKGATVAEAAHAHHGVAQKAGGAKWKQTERKLRALVQRGVATVSGRTAVGVPVRFHAVVIPHGHRHGHAPSGGPMDNSMDTPMDARLAARAVAGQAMDTRMDATPPHPSMDTLRGVYSPPGVQGSADQAALFVDDPTPRPERKAFPS